MNNVDMRPVELLLETIADELFLARVDRENELGIKNQWNEEDRALCAERIKKTRDRFDNYPDL